MLWKISSVLLVAMYIVGMIGWEGYRRFFRGNHREGNTFDV